MLVDRSSTTSSFSVMTRRYYVSKLPSQGGPIVLPDAEAVHAVRVMRVQIGDAIELFDGHGNECEAIVRQISRNHCECEASAPRGVDREPGLIIDLGIALPKPDRAKELIERLTELGVRRVTPLIAERSQRPPSDSLLEKLSRAVIEACKQSGRNQLLEIDPSCRAADFFSATRNGTQLLAHPESQARSMSSLAEDDSFTVAIGPEGGWTDQEVEIAKREGFQTLNLGERIYRVETAAVAIAATLVSTFGVRTG
jgi:16S rRNA (uracil1498-N3)-methyltransferase